MKPSELKSEISRRHGSKIKRPILVESSPGIGKTQIAYQVSDELGIDFKAVHAPLMLPEDYGMPIVTGKDRDRLKFVVSADKFPLEGDDSCEDEGIFLIDEISQADAAGQKILANLVQEREIHGHRIKDGWTIVATGNSITDRAGANRILGHLSNRVTRINLEASLDDWVQWALDNDIRTEVISFLRFRPELFSKYDPKQEVNATPRAWSEGVSAALGNTANEFEVFKGDVGEGPASEFLAFLKVYRKLPNIDDILMNPTKALIPKDDPATMYALSGALVNKSSVGNFERALTYMKRLPPEFCVLYIKDAIDKNPDIRDSKFFIKWATSKEAQILI